MCEGIPLRRVLRPERDCIVGPDVDILRIAEVLHLAHVDVVEHLWVAIHVFRRRDPGWMAPLVEHTAAGIVERQTQTKADSRLDLAHTLEDLLSGDQIDPAELVIITPITPRRAIRSPLPPFAHRAAPPMSTPRHAARRPCLDQDSI